MRAICIQPPLVQLNAPYPAAWYLDAWLRSRGVDSRAVDHSIGLARRVFSREGLATVFGAARKSLLGRKHPDEETARRVRAYLDDEAAYIATIDSIAGFLSGEDPAYAYRIAAGSGLPAGMRAEAVFGDGIGPDDARAFATATINDLSDFITYALDPGFGAVRYAERIARSAASFAPIREAARDGWTIGTFYRPMLREEFGRFAADAREKPGRDEPARDTEPALVLVSVPFPGCLTGAVAAAEEARAALGPSAVIVAGGGYVSTELRFLEDPAVFDSFDYLAYDAGFGALASILDVMRGSPRSSLFRVRYRDGAGRAIASGFPPDEPCLLAAAAAQSRAPASGPALGTVSAPASGAANGEPGGPDYAVLERDAIARVHPDYSGLDFSRYLRVVDSPNPMHRLWNDTPWLKYRLAYGCYWKRCAFCDTQLDYIKRFMASDLDSLLGAASAAAERTGLYGIHFVDEAMPVNLARAFAGRNAERERPFTFWGNVRFDKAWTDEACAFMAERGLVAVSGGIEIATREGLAIVDKGFSVSDLVRTLAAFKRAGILVHAYLIYGFPGQSDQDIADSAEMARVLLAEGLVDSAFWHKFVLTRHSAMYASWERGERPSLEPIAPRTSFALGDLSFRGEERSERWTAPLDAALSAWADEGEPERPLSGFLPKGLPRPRLDARAALKEAGIL
ncbi:MAG: radical SAM protein [Spirochaetes bacterium]|nr:radical SAM protein [Spirochaetota bacterium]MBU1080839.1 radical SAM protein [Spirochaetota bacterium]